MSLGQPPSVVRRHEVLEEAHLPEELVARAPQAEELRAQLSPVAKRLAAAAWLHGPPGSGKTATARTVTEALRRDAGVKVAYVNCLRADTAYLVLAKAAEELRILARDQRRDALSKLDALAKEATLRPFLLVLDEFDVLPERDRALLIVALTDIGRLGLVCIAPSTEALLAADERVRSRFRPATVAFAAYSADELVAILAGRADLALTAGSYSRSQLARIAELAAGDARIALQTLRRAAFLADREHEAFLSDRAIDAAFAEMRGIRRQYALRGLTPDHRLVYDLVGQRPGMTAKEIRERYLASARPYGMEPASVRSLRRYLQTLVQLRLLEVRIGGPRRSTFAYRQAG